MNIIFRNTLIRFFSICLIFSFQTINAQSVLVKNTSSKKLKDYTVEFPLPKNLPLGIYSAIQDDQAVPVEIITDIYGNQKAIFPVAEIAPKSTMKFLLRKGSADTYPKRTYAEIAHKIGGKFVGNRYEGGFSWVKPNYMKVSGDFKDHAYYIKYEGPGWESDKSAFRFYLDQRNGLDVFGKKTPNIVLSTVGADGYDNYHNMADWGMDNMKVGKSLGLGSIARWDGSKAVRVEKRDSAVCYISADGKIRSQVMTTFYGWDVNGEKCNLKSLISIDAGSRASHMELLADKPLKNIVTGIFKDKNGELITSNDSNGEWAYMATFGKQSLNNDMQGLVIFYRKSQLQKITEDELNHVLILTPQNGYAEYYFMPTWELDWEPVVDRATFEKCINEVLDRLNNPVNVTFKKK